jgi:hypothetical protein
MVPPTPEGFLPAVQITTPDFEQIYSIFLKRQEYFALDSPVNSTDIL